MSGKPSSTHLLQQPDRLLPYHFLLTSHSSQGFSYAFLDFFSQSALLNHPTPEILPCSKPVVTAHIDLLSSLRCSTQTHFGFEVERQMKFVKHTHCHKCRGKGWSALMRCRNACALKCEFAVCANKTRTFMKCLAQNASLPTDRDLVVNYFWSMTPKVVQRATFRPRAMGHAFFDTNDLFKH